MATQDTLVFTSQVKRSRIKAISFTIDGEAFSFKPPKTAALVLPILSINFDDLEDPKNLTAIKERYDWLSAGLSDEQAARVEEKLRDPKDDFDLDDLNAVIDGLVTAAAARRPTPASSGS